MTAQQTALPGVLAVISPAATLTEVPHTGADDQLRGLIGGWIERVPLAEDLDLWCDEEFVIKPHLRYNPVASLLAGQAIHGTVVVAGSHPPETTPVPDAVLDRLRQLTAAARAR